MTKWLDFTISAVFTGALILFFALVLPYHLVFMENYQMFLFTPGYFVKTVLCPGGISDYLSRFLTQFFISPLAGALIMALVISSVQRLTWHNSRCKEAWLYPLSFIPSLILVAFHCDYMAMLSASVSILASLAALKATQSIADDMKRTAVAAVLAAFMFFAFGSISILFIIPVIVRSPKSAAVLLPVAVLCLVSAWMITNYPLDGLLRGLHYYGTDDFPYLAWCGAVAAMVFPMLKSSRGSIFCIISSAFTIVLGILFIGKSMKGHNSIEREQSFKYVFLLRDKKWDEILDEYSKDANPNSVFAIASHNMALGVNGRLADELFAFRQIGTEGLLPEYKLDYLMPFVLSGIYYELGMFNEAQRFAFEAMQSIPHFQRSAQCCRTMARVACINGDYDVARKYYKELSHTLFYRKDALNALNGMAENGSGIEDLRDKRLEQTDEFYFQERLPGQLRALYEKNKGNALALQYLMGYLMLQGDTEQFRSCYEKYLGSESSIPKAYAQALLADWTKHHRTFDGLPWNIPEEEKAECSEFIDDVMARKTKSHLKTKYGDSYLFYLLYMNRK